MRQRKKPKVGFIQKSEEAIKKEKCFLIKRAYSIGKLRGKKDTIAKAWGWIISACSKYPITAEELSVLKQSFDNAMKE